VAVIHHCYMVDYRKWDKLAAGIGDDYEQEDEDGKREWLSKWEIENAKLQREWMGEKEAAERGQADPTATWNGQPGGSLRSQLGLREEGSAAAASASGDAGGSSALDQMLKMPAFQRAIRGEEDPSEEDMRQLEALAASAQNRENPTGGYMWVPPRCAPSEGDKKPVYKDAIRMGKGECDDEAGDTHRRTDPNAHSRCASSVSRRSARQPRLTRPRRRARAVTWCEFNSLRSTGSLSRRRCVSLSLCPRSPSCSCAATPARSAWPQT
jgi:hypothetical protein